jgi:hypothetical protein
MHFRRKRPKTIPNIGEPTRPPPPPTPKPNALPDVDALVREAGFDEARLQAALAHLREELEQGGSSQWRDGAAKSDEKVTFEAALAGLGQFIGPRSPAPTGTGAPTTIPKSRES